MSSSSGQKQHPYHSSLTMADSRPLTQQQQQRDAARLDRDAPASRAAGGRNPPPPAQPLFQVRKITTPQAQNEKVHQILGSYMHPADQDLSMDLQLQSPKPSQVTHDPFRNNVPRKNHRPPRSSNAEPHSGRGSQPGRPPPSSSAPVAGVPYKQQRHLSPTSGPPAACYSKTNGDVKGALKSGPGPGPGVGPALVPSGRSSSVPPRYPKAPPSVDIDEIVTTLHQIPKPVDNITASPQREHLAAAFQNRKATAAEDEEETVAASPRHLSSSRHGRRHQEVSCKAVKPDICTTGNKFKTPVKSFDPHISNDVALSEESEDEVPKVTSKSTDNISSAAESENSSESESDESSSNSTDEDQQKSASPEPQDDTWKLGKIFSQPTPPPSKPSPMKTEANGIKSRSASPAEDNDQTPTGASAVSSVSHSYKNSRSIVNSAQFHIPPKKDEFSKSRSRSVHHKPASENDSSDEGVTSSPPKPKSTATTESKIVNNVSSPRKSASSCKLSSESDSDECSSLQRKTVIANHGQSPSVFSSSRNIVPKGHTEAASKSDKYSLSRKRTAELPDNNAGRFAPKRRPQWHESSSDEDSDSDADNINVVDSSPEKVLPQQVLNKGTSFHSVKESPSSRNAVLPRSNSVLRTTSHSRPKHGKGSHHIPSNAFSKSSDEDELPVSTHKSSKVSGSKKSDSREKKEPERDRRQKSQRDKLVDKRTPQEALNRMDTSSPHPRLTPIPNESGAKEPSLPSLQYTNGVPSLLCRIKCDLINSLPSASAKCHHSPRSKKLNKEVLERRTTPRKGKKCVDESNLKDSESDIMTSPSEDSIKEKVVSSIFGKNKRVKRCKSPERETENAVKKVKVEQKDIESKTSAKAEKIPQIKVENCDAFIKEEKSGGRSVPDSVRQRHSSASSMSSIATTYSGSHYYKKHKRKEHSRESSKEKRKHRGSSNERANPQDHKKEPVKDSEKDSTHSRRGEIDKQNIRSPSVNASESPAREKATYLSPSSSKGEKASQKTSELRLQLSDSLNVKSSRLEKEREYSQNYSKGTMLPSQSSQEATSRSVQEEERSSRTDQTFDEAKGKGGKIVMHSNNDKHKSSGEDHRSCNSEQVFSRSEHESSPYGENERVSPSMIVSDGLCRYDSSLDSPDRVLEMISQLEKSEYRYYSSVLRKKGSDIKHRADNSGASIQEMVMYYLDALIYFILSGTLMESGQSLKMYEQSLKLSTYIEKLNTLRNNSHEEIGILSVLNLRCRSLLSYTIYSLRKNESDESQKLVTEHFKTYNAAYEDCGSGRATSGSSSVAVLTNGSVEGNCTSQCTSSSPNSISPTPSPAESVGSQSSGYTTSTEGNRNNRLNCRPVGQMQTTPQLHARHHNGISDPQILQQMKKVIDIQNSLVSAHETWKKANDIIQECNLHDFFKSHVHLTLDIHSELEDLFRFVHTGVDACRKLFCTPAGGAAPPHSLRCIAE